jgi:hypothetical protein
VSLTPRIHLTPRLRFGVVGLAAVVALAACSGGSPLTALKPYAASDGLQVTAGDVRGLNLILLTRGEGEPAALTGTLDNASTSNATATLGVAGTSVTLEVPAGSSVRLGLADGDTPVVAPASPAAPGLVATVELTVGGTTTKSPVPVLDGTLPEYAAVLTTLDAYLAAHD